MRDLVHFEKKNFINFGVTPSPVSYCPNLSSFKADLEDDSISYLESTVHYSHILPAKDSKVHEDGEGGEEGEEQPEESQMGDDFSPPGYLQV